MYNQTVMRRLDQLEEQQRDRDKAARPSLAMPVDTFIERTVVEIKVSAYDVDLIPFTLWPAQRDALALIQSARLVAVLKSRQLGISWATCGFVLHEVCTKPGQSWLLLSQGRREANELIRRIGLMYDRHRDRDALPSLLVDNLAEKTWSNRSRVVSLPATKNAGRSLAASGVVLDEWAFMAWPAETLASIKPVIDAGGKLIVVSSADGQGTPYHQFWQAAESGASGYAPLFLPWQARPDRGTDWRDQKMIEAHGDTASVLREYPANPIEAFTAAAGAVFAIWSDGPDGGNVTLDAEYIPDGGETLLAIDDGYAGKLDRATGHYTADSHPRAILWAQIRGDGHIDIFNETYATEKLSEQHLAEALAMPQAIELVQARFADLFPNRAPDSLLDLVLDVRGHDVAAFYAEPEYAVVDSAAAELRGRVQAAGIGTYGKPGDVEESIKVLRRMLAPDLNGWRRVRVHPRCKHLRFEMAAYRNDDRGKPIAQHDHGVSAMRYLAWRLRDS